jgi:hypothetical protein
MIRWIVYLSLFFFMEESITIENCEEEINEPDRSEVNWCMIKDAELYEVSKTGVVRIRTTKQIMKQKLSLYGYKGVALVVNSGNRKNFSIHRLVAIAFIPNPNKYAEVDHIDRVRQNNNVANLRWANRTTQAQNRTYNQQSGVLQRRPVAQYNLQSGELIKEYPSASFAGAECDLNRETVLRSCKGRANAGGYEWRYVDIASLDGEIWKEVPSKYDVRGYYVSNMGRIRYPGGRVLDTVRKSKRYVDISLKHKQYRAHIIIAETFLEPPGEGQNVVNHIDGDIMNNKLCNLEWTTPSGNSLHAHATGLSKTSKRIKRTDTRNGTVIMFPNIKSCAKDSGINKNTLSTIINQPNHQRKTKKHYTFEVMKY